MKMCRECMLALLFSAAYPTLPSFVYLPAFDLYSPIIVPTLGADDRFAIIAFIGRIHGGLCGDLLMVRRLFSLRLYPG